MYAYFTIRAIAIASGLSSLLTEGAYAINLICISLSPTAFTSLPSQMQGFTGTVSGASSTNVIKSISPAMGSISATSHYAESASMETPQTRAVIVASSAHSTHAASSSIALDPSGDPPAKLTFLAQPSDSLVNSAIAPAIKVAIEDSEGHVLSTASNEVALTLSSEAGLSGTVTAMPQNGVVTFKNLEVSQVGSGYTLTATSFSLEAATSSAFTISAVVPASPVRAKSADSFVDSIGLNVHFGYYGSIYATQTPMLLSAIGKLNIRHLRDQMFWNGSRTTPFYRTHEKLASMGVKTEFQLTSINYPLSEIVAFSSLVGDMEAAEPTNEYDNSGDPDWAANIRAQQAQLYAQMKSNPATKHMIVVAPSLAQPIYAPKIGNISAMADVGDSHAYFQGWNPGNDGIGKNNTARFIKLAQVNVPSKPVWVTETGFWSQQVMYWGGAGNGEALMATYAPRALLEFWNSGAQRTYLYELADYESGDYFGLIRMDGSYKPAFYSVANLLGLLKEPGASFIPGSLSYSLTGSTTQVNKTLLQKSDGSYYLILWVEAPAMNVSTLANIRVAKENVTVNLARFPASVTRYQWDATGSVTTSTLAASQTVSVSIGPNITVLKIL